MRTLSLCSLLVLLALTWGCPPPVEPQPPAKPVPTVAPTEATGPDRSTLPQPKAAPMWAPPEVTTWQLGNGMDVWFLRQDQAPLLSLYLVFDRGSGTDPPDKAGLTALTADLLDEGAGDLSALELGEALQRLATDYDAYATRDGVLLSLHLLADQLVPSLRLLSDIARRPHLSDAELERRRDLLIAQAVANQADPNAIRGLVLRRALFGLGFGGPAGNGTPTTLERIRLPDVKAHYQGLIQPEGAAFVVVGAIDQQPLRDALESTFGDWRGKPTTLKARPVSSEPPKAGIYLVNFPQSTQSSIALASRAAGANAPDYHAAEIFNWALGGAFTSRLNLNLREDKGYTYGARSVFVRHKPTGLLALTAQVKAETTQASLAEMYRELAQLNGDVPLTDQERAEAVGGLLLGFPGRFERLQDVGSRLADLKLTGRDANWYRSYADRIAKVTLAEAVASAKLHTSAADFVAVVAGPLDQVEPTLKALGQPLFYCDREGSCGDTPPAAK